MVKEYKFDIMYKDELVSEVSVQEGTVNVTKHINHVGIQPFYSGEITMKRVEDFLKTRCFDAARADTKDLLYCLELDSYNPLAIIKKTHGRMFHDYLWIKFPGETLVWEDVRNGQN